MFLSLLSACLFDVIVIRKINENEKKRDKQETHTIFAQFLSHLSERERSLLGFLTPSSLCTIAKLPKEVSSGLLLQFDRC